MRALIIVFALMYVCAARAQDASPEPTPDTSVASAPVEPAAEPVLDEVLVTGEQPGPGLWKVTKPDAGNDHVLWILGSHSPVPKKMTWRSKEVEFTIAESQELITVATVKADIGFFKGLTLLPSLIGIRDSPNDAKLKDVVPADVYARWLVLKEKYIGRDKGIEEWRPIFAAAELYQEAIKDSGLDIRNAVSPVVEKLAKKHKLKITTPVIKLEVEKPRAMIKEFKKAEVNDLACFAKTIERIEDDLYKMRARANAWAVGNIKAMRNLTYVDQIGTCISAVLDNQMVKDHGMEDMPERFATAWIDAVEAAMAKNKSTFAVLSVDEIMRTDGFVARLKAKGYAVEEP
jgi:hypothetical protein